MSRIMNLRVYKGYIYWGKKGEWFCDLFDEPFKSLNEFKECIDDKISCGE